MTELWVKDKHGKPRDIILGYDDNVRILDDILCQFWILFPGPYRLHSPCRLIRYWCFYFILLERNR